MQPDSIIPNPANPQSWNRYSYVYNNPIRYNDPTGHFVDGLLDIGFIAYDIYDIGKNGLNWTNGLALVADVVGAAIPMATGLGAVVRLVSRSDNVARGTKTLVSQIHHFATNKNKRFTPLFEEIAKKFDLDLDGPWNKLPVPGHRGRHPNAYHEWVLDQMEDIASKLSNCKKNCTDKFIERFDENVIQPVMKTPEMLRKKFWEIME